MHLTRMSKITFIACVAIGILIGAGVHYLKTDTDRTEQIMRDRPVQTYQACLDFNALVEEVGREEEPKDCSEYLP